MNVIFLPEEPRQTTIIIRYLMFDKEKPLQNKWNAQVDGGILDAS